MLKWLRRPRPRTVGPDSPTSPALAADGSVLYPWVEQLSWKEQSILFSGLRGPDHMHLPRIKEVCKWIRSVSQRNAGDTEGYMNNIVLPELYELAEDLEKLPCHFVHHLADALAVVAYGHPDDAISRYAFSLHTFIAEDLFHFVPEPPEVFHWRHRDMPDGTDPCPLSPATEHQWMDALLPGDYFHH